jgi:hypothetical protein
VRLGVIMMLVKSLSKRSVKSSIHSLQLECDVMRCDAIDGCDAIAAAVLCWTMYDVD